MKLGGIVLRKRGVLSGTGNRIDELFNYRIPDRVPLGSLSIGFNAVNAGYSVREVLEDPEKCFQAAVWTADLYDWDPLPQYSGHTVWGAIDFGGEVRMPVGPYESSLIVTSHPVRCEGDLSTLKLPDPESAGRIPLAMAFSRLQAENGFPVFFSSRSPLTMAANICGLENFCRWMIRKPELCRELMDLALTHILNVLTYWIPPCFRWKRPNLSMKRAATSSPEGRNSPAVSSWRRAAASPPPPHPSTFSP